MANAAKIITTLFRALSGAAKGWQASSSKRSVREAQPAYTTFTITPQHHWPAHEDYDFECEVVGESHHQQHLQALAGKHGKDSAEVLTTALLLPEPNNPHDKNAVRIYLSGKAVGYLPKDDAKAFLQRLTRRKLAKIAPTTCNAKIMGGFALKDGSKASYGVVLNMLPFYED